jgi:hypothetical protein
MIGIEWIELGNTASFLGFNRETFRGDGHKSWGWIQNLDITLRCGTVIHDFPLFVPKLGVKPLHFNSPFNHPTITDFIYKRGLHCSSKGGLSKLCLKVLVRGDFYHVIYQLLLNGIHLKCP